MRDPDFDGLTDRNALADMELANDIMNRIDSEIWPTSAEKIFLRWYMGLSLTPPKDYRQTEMAVTSGE